ncbi:hypothetical protein [Dietzia aurantiaca]|uniref:DUF3800 domain-containing protein n=1 Tax=Dietzia aurantiaca TaxID=983873 RepID=A0ABV9PUN1_9ACTN
MDPRNRGDLERLTARYRSLPGRERVAFVDEAYRLPNDCRPGEKPFYALAAVLLTIDDHVDIRADLHRIVGGNWWHTVDAQQTQDGLPKIEELTDYLADYRDPCVLAVCHTPGPDDQAIGMRAVSLSALLAALDSQAPRPGAGEGHQRVVPAQAKMTVLERQNRHQDTDRDLHTIRQARQSGAISRHFPVMHVSPSIENLLWLPDLVSHTYRRYITHDEDLVTRLDGQTVTLELPANKSDPLGAAAYVQGVSRLFQ